MVVEDHAVDLERGWSAADLSRQSFAVMRERESYR